MFAQVRHQVPTRRRRRRPGSDRGWSAKVRSRCRGCPAQTLGDVAELVVEQAQWTSSVMAAEECPSICCRNRRTTGREAAHTESVAGRMSSDARRVVAAQGVRALGYGFSAVMLGALLAGRNYSPVRAGVVLGALVAGTA